MPMFNSRKYGSKIPIIIAVAVIAVAAIGCNASPIDNLPSLILQAATVTLMTLVPSTSPTPMTPVPSTPPTLIFYDGIVLTMDKTQPTAEAIAVADDKIIAVGSSNDILALKTANTQIIDLQGQTLMPGFVDSHTHILNEASSLPAVGTLEKAQEIELENGVTMVGNLYTTSDFLAQMRALDASGKLLIRINLYLTYSDPCGKVLGNWYQQFPPTRTPGEMLRIAGVKVFSDGGSCEYPAVSFDRILGGKGNLWFTQDQLNTIVSDINKAGYQVAIHAIGDRGVNEALNAIEYSLGGQPNVLRDRIEHNTTVNPVDLPRYQEIGVVATIIGNIWSCTPWYGGPDPLANQPWNFSYRAMLDANPNGHFAWHSDYPWASPNPLYHLYSLVTSKEIAGDLSECPDPSWVGNKTLTIDEALPMMNIEGAYAMFRENEVGSLVAGKYADLIILSGNPKADLNNTRNLAVWMTMVGGIVRWCAAGHEDLCPGSSVAENLPASPTSSPIRIRLQLDTTSDWATLTLNSGGNLVDPVVVSQNGVTTAQGAGNNQISINQTIDHANSGASVGLVVDATLSDAQTSGQLEFVIQSGAIGDTTVKFYNYVNNAPVEVSSAVLNDTSKTVDLPVSMFISQ